MAIHSSILSWEIPRTEESGGLVHSIAKSWTRLSTEQVLDSLACSIVIHSCLQLSNIFG